MDNRQYLARIAAKPAPPTTNKLFDPKMIKIVVVLIIAVFTVIILANLLGDAANKPKALTEQLYLRLTNLSADSSPIVTYGHDVKSPELRSLATSLKSALIASAHDLSTLLPTLKIDPEEINQTTAAAESDHITALTTDLANAKLNGILDRIYSKDLALQISDLLYLESSLLEKTSDPSLITALEKSTTDLTILHTKFTDFSNSSN
jgi:hypothetical protein